MNSGTGISIAALLDRASENKRLAEMQTEDQKAKGHDVSKFPACAIELEP
jgi:hypothetical protein